MLTCTRVLYHDLSFDHRFAYLDDPESMGDPLPVIVLLDSSAVLAYMLDDAERFPLRNKQLKALDAIALNGRLELPVALWWESKLDICEGRHRAAWLARAGYPTIPFVTAEHMAEDLLHALGSGGHETSLHYDFSQFARFRVLSRQDI
ncbi:MAG: hypothetical protein ABW154_07875 [Dyella sp.]